MILKTSIIDAINLVDLFINNNLIIKISNQIIQVIINLKNKFKNK